MNDANICVFDFETCGEMVWKNNVLDASVVYPIEIACVLVEPRKLSIIPGSEFVSTMRPPAGCVMNKQALETNGKKEEDIRAYPTDTNTVWKMFCEHVKRFNIKRPPIAAGKNIRTFDLPIANWLCHQIGHVDKDGNQKLFDNRRTLDLEDFLFHWFENSTDIDNLKMDTVRPFYGLSSKNAHTALKDVQDTAKLIVYHLNMYRRAYPKAKLKGAFACKK